MNLVELESELMLLGIWKNFEELEHQLSLPEMEALLKASRESEHRKNSFAAALKGINIDEGEQDDIQARAEEIKARAEARLRGENPDIAEYAAMGIVYQVEE